MNRGINLLPQEEKHGSSGKNIFYIRIAALVCLVLLALSAVILFILNLSSQLPSLQNQHTALVAEIAKYNKKRVSLAIINNRLKNTSDILQKRVELNSQLSMLLGKFPQDVAVVGASLNGKVIKIDTSSTSLKSLEDLSSNLVSLQSDLHARAGIIESLGYGVNKRYFMSFQIDL